MAMYTLTIVTPEEVVFEDEVISLVAPGSEGYLGVLTDHAPLITALVPGKLTVKDKRGKESVFSLSGGFLEVSNNVATILADTVEPREKIDVERARQALERAKERLQTKSQEIDVARAQAALSRALNRIKVYEESNP
ncbi:MAG: ATP synthase F0F1 subunit epsilon [candidate division Zixibacteria bacterium DG_27]|nr:MAG: ATP synthase F0F1 subunit epsilon [candidate division Zixibacteria bacterium DG_27]